MSKLPEFGIQTVDDLAEAFKKYLPYFIPDITVVDDTDDGGKIANFMAAVVKNLHYHLNYRYNASNLSTVRKLEDILKVVSVNDYKNPGPSAALATGKFDSTKGAVAADLDIPQWTTVKTSKAPSVYGVLATALKIAAGGTSVTGASIIQGKRYTSQAVGVGTGAANQSFAISLRYIPKLYLIVYVNAVEIHRAESLYDYGDTDLVYRADYDHEGSLSIVFGDGVYGKKLGLGDTVTADWIVDDGADGNFSTEDRMYDSVEGGLKSLLSFTQQSSSKGGSNNPTVSTVRRTAPKLQQSVSVVRRKEDAEALATVYDGVYKAKVIRPGGSVLSVYVMPDGGGAASQTLLDNLQSYLQSKAMAGIVIETYGLVTAPLLATMRIVLQAERHRVSRNVVSDMVLTAIEADLDYQVVEVGRGYKLSDLAAVVEGIGSGTYVDYVDISRFLRYPRIVKSRAAAPGVINIGFTSSLLAGIWTITMYNLTKYFVSYNGQVLQTLGTIGSLYTYGGFSFIVGEVGDGFLLGDTYTLYTSAYNENITLQNDEYMYYRGDSDFDLNVVHKEEDES